MQTKTRQPSRKSILRKKAPARKEAIPATAGVVPPPVMPARPALPRAAHDTVSRSVALTGLKYALRSPLADLVENLSFVLHLPADSIKLTGTYADPAVIITQSNGALVIPLREASQAPAAPQAQSQTKPTRQDVCATLGKIPMPDFTPFLETTAKTFGIPVDTIKAEFAISLPSNVVADPVRPVDAGLAVIENVVDTLNDAFVADPVAMLQLFTYRVPCDVALIDHPSILVSPSYALGGENPLIKLGFLGLLNGLLEPLTGYLVVALWSKDGVFQGFAIGEALE